MLIKCYVKGAVVGVNGGSIDVNPYETETEAHADWLTGHFAGGVAAKRMLEAKTPIPGPAHRVRPQILG